MQNITFFRMQGLKKLWPFWQCGDSQFSQYVNLLVAHCTDVHYFTRGCKGVISKEGVKLFGYGQIDSNYITPLWGFSGEQYVFQTFVNCWINRLMAMGSVSLSPRTNCLHKFWGYSLLVLRAKNCRGIFCLLCKIVYVLIYTEIVKDIYFSSDASITEKTFSESLFSAFWL